MRPLELRLRNFRSYFGEDAVFDFRNRGLVGIVGPIGSGKSSLLDAIAFALFGRTPTVAASTKALIHQRADGATVRLRFSIDDEIWEVTRALRRKGQSVHGLVRLEADTEDPGKLESLVLESEVNVRIVELLGLEFDGFSRSIMLAQGRFAEFLRARPAERDKVLKGVFGHDKVDLMRTEAKVRAAAETTRAETLGVRLEAADALVIRLDESRETLAADEKRLELLRKAEAKFADHAERTTATTRVISHAETRLAELEPMTERLPAPDLVAEVVTISKSANKMRARLGEALDVSQSDLVSADKALAALDPPALRTRIDEAARREVIREQLIGQQDSTSASAESLATAAATLATHLQSSREQLAASTTAQTALEADAAARGLDREAAAAVLHKARHDNMAGTLRGSLEIGEPCPVCEQSVAATPPAMTVPALEEAEAALQSAELTFAAVQKDLIGVNDDVGEKRVRLGAIEAELGGVNKEIAAMAKQMKKLAVKIEKTDAELAKLHGESTVTAMREGLAAAEAAVAEARKSFETARAEHDEAIRAEQAAAKELGTLRLSLAELATRLDLELASADDVDAVADAVSAVRQAWTDTTETLNTAKIAAEHERAEIAASSRQVRLELSIEGEFATHLAETVATIDVRRQQIESDEKTLAQSDEVRAARDAANTQRAIYEKLSSELTDSKFVRYLLDEEKRDLANLGSEHFARLSSGRYRFSIDGGFDIVDLTSADAVRKADSLSGGETFLASLALALALAEMVARTGGRLDAFFLDEGFGSLDAEHLDLAMEGIEQLAAGASDRLVLVVSHVPDMRHRLEDLIELDRDPVTGDTVVGRG